VRYARLIILASTLLAGGLPAAAAWENTLVVYGMGSSIEGDATFLDATLEVDVPLDELIDDLEFVAMAAYRGQADHWAIVVDTQFIALGQSTSPAVADLDMLMLEIDGAYRLTERFDLYLGARYLGTESRIEFAGPLGSVLEGEEDVVDPIVGFSGRLPLGKKFRFHFRGDVGGFGVGSELTWQGQANLGFTASDLISIWLGYRAIGYDIEFERRAGALGLDMVLHGPQLGVAFHL